MNFTAEQLKRYNRHIIMDEIGEAGQRRLLNSKVLIIGAGGLGSPVAMYLSAMGVGAIGIADADVVDFSNLQRQIIHTTNDVGREKVLSAKEKMEHINPDVRVKTYSTFITAENILSIIEEYDFILDCTDNFSSKFLINDACVIAKKPFCHGGIMKLSGQLMTYVPNKGPCYRCIFEEPPKVEVPTCKDVGVVGAVAGVIGSLQAIEAIKYLVGFGELLVARLLTYNALTMEFRTVKFPERVKTCSACGEHPTVKIL